MDEDEAKRLVLDEFRIWCTAREIKLPALRSLAIEFYFDQLEADRRDLLDFPSEAGKWQVVQAWLRNARLCR
jgi:hypothetical protein